jgi:hypothetical protein
LVEEAGTTVTTTCKTIEKWKKLLGRDTATSKNAQGLTHTHTKLLKPS